MFVNGFIFASFVGAAQDLVSVTSTCHLDVIFATHMHSAKLSIVLHGAVSWSRSWQVTLSPRLLALWIGQRLYLVLS